MSNTKRELLASLLAGNVASLQTYQRQQRQQNPAYTRIIDERPVGGVIMVHLKEGGQRQMSDEEFEQLPSKIGIWTIRDMTGGNRVPEVDEDY